MTPLSQKAQTIDPPSLLAQKPPVTNTLGYKTVFITQCFYHL